MLGYGSLGAGLFYMIIGNFGLSLQLEETVIVTEVMVEQGVPVAIVSILDQLPLATLAIIIYALIALIFSATTYDSASYILASVATRRSSGRGKNRIVGIVFFWAFALAVLPLTLMFVGGLKVIQSATLVVSLPLIGVGVLMSVALVRQLRLDHA